MDWLDLLAIQGTLKSLLQQYSSKASICWCSAFFIVQLSRPCITTGKTIALTGWTFVGKLISLLFNMLSSLVITFLPRSKCLFISWLQSPSAVILEPPKIKSVTVSPSICHEVMGLEAMILVLWMLSFKPTFSLFSFTFIKRLFSSSSAAAAKSLQSCPTLWDPIDGSPLASSSLGFSRQEHWSGLPFPPPMHESEKWKWSHSDMSDSLWSHGLQPTRLLHPWDFPGKSTGVGCHCLQRSSSSLSVKRISAYLRLLIVLLAILIPACASSSPTFLMMFSAYKLNKQSDNIQPWCTPFPIWNQSVVPCPVLTVASWPAYRFFKRQVD